MSKSLVKSDISNEKRFTNWEEQLNQLYTRLGYLSQPGSGQRASGLHAGGDFHLAVEPTATRSVQHHIHCHNPSCKIELRLLERKSVAQAQVGTIGTVEGSRYIPGPKKVHYWLSLVRARIVAHPKNFLKVDGSRGLQCAEQIWRQHRHPQSGRVVWQWCWSVGLGWRPPSASPSCLQVNGEPLVVEVHPSAGSTCCPVMKTIQRDGLESRHHQLIAEVLHSLLGGAERIEQSKQCQAHSTFREAPKLRTHFEAAGLHARWCGQWTWRCPGNQPVSFHLPWDALW